MKKYPVVVSGIIALIGSLIANTILVKLFLPMTGVPASVMTFKVAGPVGIFTLMGVIGAVIVFSIVRAASTNPNKVFTIIAAIALLISFVPDIFVHNLGPMFAQITMGGILLLIVLHSAVAVVTVWALTRLSVPSKKEMMTAPMSM